MSSRKPSALYLFFKARSMLDYFIGSLATRSRGKVPDPVTWDSKMTVPILMTGPAMSPRFVPNAEKDRGAKDVLLVRRIYAPLANYNIYVDDVVACANPQPQLGTSGLSNLLVRRVESFVDEDSEQQRWTEGKACWVVAENTALEPPEVQDSRSFGPVPMENILGRVIYYARSRTDRGPVENAMQSQLGDQAVIDEELDEEEFLAELD